MGDPFDLQAFHAALDQARAERGLSWAQVARQSGVAASTIARAATASDMEADGMLFLAVWLGATPESFVRRSQELGNLTVAEGHLRTDTPLLHAALDDERTARGLTWKDVAAELDVPGVSAASLTRLRNGGRTTAQLLVAAAQWLDRSSRSLTRRSPA